MRNLPLCEVMSAHPYSIGLEATLEEAQREMRRHRIHPLPVMSGRQLVGLVSMDDVHLAQSIGQFDPDTAGVAEALEASPLTVPFSATVSEVVSRMVTGKREAAVVLEGPPRGAR